MILNLDCRLGLALYPDNFFDSIVTDPPYELGFMGKSWDATGIAYDVAMWRECMRVLKPGGHLLAFSGSRTYHRMACAIEDAGFEMRDQIMWIYGSGFPKSLDVAKAIDKADGYQGNVIGTEFVDVGMQGGSMHAGSSPSVQEREIRELSDKAQAWQGWGTALKPAHEPICVARKPLVGTVAQNVLAHGTGALNIDGCRIPGEKPATTRGSGGQHGRYSKLGAQGRIEDDGLGRWPANVIHDGSDEVLQTFPQAPGALAAVTGNEPSDQTNNVYGEFDRRVAREPRREEDKSAARFFYCAKASKADRDIGLNDMPEVSCGMMEDDNYAIKTGSGNLRDTKRRNNHPTVKPEKLMRYLVRLVTPPGGCVLDPFAGSGSTGKAAILEGFQFVGFELDPHYAKIAERRLTTPSINE